MTAERTLLAKAHAKLNFGLAVLGKRPDGYHEIDTLFVRVELHDDVSLAPASRLTGELQKGALPLEGLRMDGHNLAMRAAAAYLDHVPGAGVHIRLSKRIPVAAGLGGGSSDAAAVLAGLKELCPAAVDLEGLALSLGSDVPFFVSGASSARAGGRGERLVSLSVPPQPLVLANPMIAVSAASAYGALRGPSAALDADRVLVQLAAGREPGYDNALQSGVVANHPVVGETLEALRMAGLRGVLMSGSGPTCFGLAGSIDEARAVAERIRAEHRGWWVWAGWAGV
jgi:4-diphosphocytidyl-2-C-methyl-D-erythritol kinase